MAGYDIQFRVTQHRRTYTPGVYERTLIEQVVDLLWRVEDEDLFTEYSYKDHVTCVL
jgi:hypothetical protein